jgi:hypothetical protein
MRLPMPLTNAESVTLRKALDGAVDEAQRLFLATTVIVDPTNGTPLGGPDPRAVDAEVLLWLARRLARSGLDLVGAAAFEAKIAELEGALANAGPPI